MKKVEFWFYAHYGVSYEKRMMETPKFEKSNQKFIRSPQVVFGCHNKDVKVQKYAYF